MRRRESQMMQIPLSNPDITELDKEYILDVLNSPDLSLGPKLQEFEAKMAYYIGAKYAVAVNSGTRETAVGWNMLGWGITIV